MSQSYVLPETEPNTISSMEHGPDLSQQQGAIGKSRHSAVTSRIPAPYPHSTSSSLFFPATSHSSCLLWSSQNNNKKSLNSKKHFGNCQASKDNSLARNTLFVKQSNFISAYDNIKIGLKQSRILQHTSTSMYSLCHSLYKLKKPLQCMKNKSQIQF